MEKAQDCLAVPLVLFSAVYNMECPMGTSPAEEQNRGLWEEAAHWRAYIPYTSA